MLVSHFINGCIWLPSSTQFSVLIIIFQNSMLIDSPYLCISSFSRLFWTVLVTTLPNLCNNFGTLYFINQYLLLISSTCISLVILFLFVLSRVSMIFLFSAGFAYISSGPCSSCALNYYVKELLC